MMEQSHYQNHHDSILSSNVSKDDMDSLELKSSKACLFVGDLAKFCTENDLKNTFSRIGLVNEVIIKKQKKNGENLGYGFVTMSTFEDAKRALEELQGTILCGRPLKIGWGSHGEDLVTSGHLKSPTQSPNSSKDKIISVYVRFSAMKDKLLVTEEKLVEVFKTFGHVIDASVKSCSWHKILNTHSGYAFVHYEDSADGIRSAFDSIRSLNQTVVDNIFFQCQPSKNLMKAAELLPPRDGFSLPHNMVNNRSPTDSESSNGSVFFGRDSGNYGYGQRHSPQEHRERHMDYYHPLNYVGGSPTAVPIHMYPAPYPMVPMEQHYRIVQMPQMFSVSDNYPHQCLISPMSAVSPYVVHDAYYY